MIELSQAALSSCGDFRRVDIVLVRSVYLKSSREIVQVSTDMPE